MYEYVGTIAGLISVYCFYKLLTYKPVKLEDIQKKYDDL
jgi:hypothetical protein